MTKPLKREWIAAADIAERRLTDMVGRALDGIPDPIRDEIAEIIEPQFLLLRREGRRNGRLAPAQGEV